MKTSFDSEKISQPACALSDEVVTKATREIRR